MLEFWTVSVSYFQVFTSTSPLCIYIFLLELVSSKDRNDNTFFFSFKNFAQRNHALYSMEDSLFSLFHSCVGYAFIMGRQ